MVLVIKNNHDKKQLDELIEWITSMKLKVNISKGEKNTVIGLIGDTSKIDTDTIGRFTIVESTKRISEPYKRASRNFHPDDTIVEVAGRKIGGKHFCFIAGPCSVESEEQILEIAKSVKGIGAEFLRGGAYKPRTSPYAFQGMREDGIKLLLKAKKQTGLPVVTEIMDANTINLFEDIDIIQVGARNMQNFELLKVLGKKNKPILLKRGLANTIEELLMSAEYIMSEGNDKVILCERGIRTFEHYTRNTLDLSAVALLKSLTHLPIIVDPSHASGLAKLVEPMSLAAAAAGSDGLIIEVHNNPATAKCDGAQSIKPEQFEELYKKVNKILPIVNKKID